MLVHVDKAVVLNVKKSERLSQATSSRGNQLKWFHNNMYIKLNNGECYEDISEVLVSYFLDFTNIKNYVEYFPCEIVEDGQYMGVGCFSRSFLNEGETDITFFRLLKNNGIDISCADYDTVRDNLLEVTGVDFKSYIDICLCVDAITFNDDRHFNNFSVIYTGNECKFAPIYDNGMACLSDVYMYPLDVPLEENLRKVFAKPFKFNFDEQLKDAHVTPILIRYNDFINSVNLSTENELRAFNVIKKGLERFKGLAWEEY